MQKYKKPIVIVMVLAVISALFFALVPPSNTPGASPSQSPTPSAPSLIDITVSGEKVSGGGDITVKQGSTAIIRVTADVNDEVHLHGYDLKANVTPTSAAVIPFEASVAGKFEVELEKRALPLAKISVVP